MKKDEIISYWQERLTRQEEFLAQCVLRYRAKMPNVLARRAKKELRKRADSLFPDFFGEEEALLEASAQAKLRQYQAHVETMSSLNRQMLAQLWESLTDGRDYHEFDVLISWSLEIAYFADRARRIQQ